MTYSPETGKTTFVDWIRSLLKRPSEAELRGQMRRDLFDTNNLEFRKVADRTLDTPGNFWFGQRRSDGSDRYS